MEVGYREPEMVPEAGYSRKDLTIKEPDSNYFI